MKRFMLVIPVFLAPAMVWAASVPDRAVWSWRSDDLATDREARGAFFAFASEHHINRVFLEAGSLVRNHPDDLSSFISKAGADGIKVELLLGDPAWARGENHVKALDRVKAALHFVKVAEEGKRPAGVHLDIEPYILPEWKDHLSSLANDYLDLLESIEELTRDAEVRATLDIPFWFDGLMITRGGTARKLSELVIDRMDRTFVMDYRDDAGKAIGSAKDEIRYAAAQHKRVGVALDAICGPPDATTFCEEGRAALEDALVKVNDALGSEDGYAGLAVHDYAGYRALAR